MNKTLKALLGSIEKWEEIVNNFGLDQGDVIQGLAINESYNRKGGNSLATLKT